MSSTNIYINIIHNIALPNKYTKWYVSIVSRGLDRIDITVPKNTQKKQAKKLLGYVEGHHIVPKCICKEETQIKDKQNIAWLTAREHFICHNLLCKMFSSNYKYKMIRATIRLVDTLSIRKQRVKSSIVYKQCKENFAKTMSSMNKGRPAWNKGLTAKTDDRLKSTPERSAQKSKWMQLHNPFRGKHHTAETKKLLSTLRKGKPGCNKNKNSITNGICQKFIKLTEPIPQGWKLGGSVKTEQTKLNIARANNVKIHTPFGIFLSAKEASETLNVPRNVIYLLTLRGDMKATSVKLQRYGWPIAWKGKTWKDIGFFKEE